jgi:hypothetical protein
MKLMRIIGMLVFAIFANSFYSSGQQRDTVKYTPDFKFDDGFYFSFNQVKNNDPVPGARLVTNLDYTDSDFYEKILQQKSIAFYDKNGALQEVPVSKLWGFSRNGVLYIKLSEGFHRITIVGRICHFVADITTYQTRYYDPYYNSRYYYSPYYDPYSPYSQRTTRNSEMKQYVLDFETGKVMDYDYKTVEILLMQDPELHAEYTELRKRKKKQLKFFYIRKFNERNPLFMPVDKKF